jgi:hypothetical protein
MPPFYTHAAQLTSRAPRRRALLAARHGATTERVSGRRHAVTAVGSVVLTALGFAAGAGGTAWRARDMRAEPWRKLQLEHRGRASTRTRVVFDDARRPLASVELQRRDGVPIAATIETRGGEPLTARFDDDKRPSALVAADGSDVQLRYGGTNVRVTFHAADGSAQGETVLRAPVELRSALDLAYRQAPGDSLVAWLGEALIGQAHAAEEGPVTVQQDLSVQLDVRAAANARVTSGRAEVQASCAPFTCLPTPVTIEVPGSSGLNLSVSRTIDKKKLGTLNLGALGPFEELARSERAGAAKALPNMAALIAALGVTAVACHKLGRGGPLCVAALGKDAKQAAAAVHALSTHDVRAPATLVRERAAEMAYEQQARTTFDKPVPVELCVSRTGFARACTSFDARPFATTPAPPVAQTLELRPGLGDALNGTFEMSQSDGADCKFSPSPSTKGKLRLSYDEKRSEMKAEFAANESGTRPGLNCSLGTATMRWSQSYSATASQTVSKDQLSSPLTLRLEGTMRGSGSFSFSGCRSRGGATANCPAGKSDSYSYRIVLTGTLDPTTRQGKGRIEVSNAPLATRGSWLVGEGSAP